jgi:DNA-binding winged helix-turn-helix (wHTH) protein
MRYVFGDYEVDTQRHKLRHKGIPCPMESQVFQVLVYLVQHRDRVVSKAELLEYPWPQQYISETTLSQRLMLVRKAVGDSGRQQRVITTVPGRGYRFVATVEEQTEIPPATARRCLRGLRPCRPRRRDGRTSRRP